MIKQVIRNRWGRWVYAALVQVREELRTRSVHQRGVREAARYARQKHLKLHLGCGNVAKEGFVNVDLGGAADVTLDLREPLPFDDGCAGLVYSEHFFEHVDYPEGTLRVLGECWRVLEPGGVFTAGVPHAGQLLLEYAGVAKTGFLEYAKTRWHPEWCETRMEQINYVFRQGTQHQFAYDAETFCHVLEKAGFVHATERPFDPSLDQAIWSIGTLFVRAEKRGLAGQTGKG